MLEQLVQQPVQAFQRTSQQVMNNGNNLPLYQEQHQRVNQIGDNFLCNPQQQVYSTTTCQSNTQQQQPAYSNVSFQVMPQQNQQQQPQHLQGFTNTNFQVQQQQVPQTQHQSYTNSNFQVQQQQANYSNTNFPILSQLVAPPPPPYSVAVGNRLQVQPHQQQQPPQLQQHPQQQVTCITNITKIFEKII